MNVGPRIFRSRTVYFSIYLLYSLLTSVAVIQVSICYVGYCAWNLSKMQSCSGLAGDSLLAVIVSWGWEIWPPAKVQSPSPPAAHSAPLKPSIQPWKTIICWLHTNTPVMEEFALWSGELIEFLSTNYFFWNHFFSCIFVKFELLSTLIQTLKQQLLSIWCSMLI